MEMVASSKLRRAQQQVLASRPYFETLYAAIHDIADADREFSSAYLQARTGGKSLHVVIAGDRGLAGGYNSNVLKLVMSEIQGKTAEVLPIGKKAVEFFQSRKIPCLTGTGDAAAMTMGDCFTVAKRLCKLFLEGTYDEIYVTYTNFVSVLSQTPGTLRLLPLIRQETGKEGVSTDMVYEPDSEQVFDTIIPEYVGGVLYCALCESRASEQAARRTAMDSATQNADEMIDGLSLQFNRARQASITQEITEIVAGSQ
jgi:F-type H+-transporting ATPase subunit gamma